MVEARQERHVRYGWLKAMYIYTIVVAGGFGLGLIVAPEVATAIFSWPVEEPIARGIIGSVYVAFGILSIFGLRAPLRFVPVLLLQLCYKAVWFVGVVVPLLAAGSFPAYAAPVTLLFASYIVGDLIAIPFSALLTSEGTGGVHVAAPAADAEV